MGGESSGANRGIIYLIRLSPDRVKLGFTSEPSVKGRVKSARTWIPEAECIGFWSGLSSWEPLARAWLEHHSELAQVGESEVFEGMRNQREVLSLMQNFFRHIQPEGKSAELVSIDGGVSDRERAE